MAVNGRGQINGRPAGGGNALSLTLAIFNGVTPVLPADLVTGVEYTFRLTAAYGVPPFDFTIEYGDGDDDTYSGPEAIHDFLYTYDAADTYTLAYGVTDADESVAGTSVEVTVSPSNFIPIADPGTGTLVVTATCVRSTPVSGGNSAAIGVSELGVPGGSYSYCGIWNRISNANGLWNEMIAARESPWDPGTPAHPGDLADGTHTLEFRWFADGSIEASITGWGSVSRGAGFAPRSTMTRYAWWDVNDGDVTVTDLAVEVVP